MLVRELEAALLAHFPCEDAESWDHVGLSVGEPDAEVTGVAIALDPTPAAVEDAHDGGANVLLTHHPVYLKAPMPSRRSTPSAPPARRRCTARRALE